MREVNAKSNIAIYEMERAVEEGFNKTKTGEAFIKLHEDKNAEIFYKLGSLLNGQESLLKVLNDCAKLCESCKDESARTTEIFLTEVTTALFEVSNDMKNDVMKDQVDEYFLSKRFIKDLLLIIDSVKIMYESVLELPITDEKMGGTLINLRGFMTSKLVFRTYVEKIEKTMNDTDHTSRYERFVNGIFDLKLEDED